VSDAALDLFLGLVLEDGRRLGEAAAPFQVADARAVLDLEGPPYHFHTRSRGSSKTSDVAGESIAVLLVQAPPQSRSYALAADREQGKLLVDAMAGYVRRTPELDGALVVRESQVVATRSGARLDVLSADQASIWGLRPYFSVADELAQWNETPPPKRCWEALSTAVLKVPGARLVVITTAGEPAHWSRRVLDHALADPLWRVHEVKGPAPWLDPERIEAERRRLPESSFRRLFLNEWAESEDRLADESDLAACCTLDGPLVPVAGVRYVIGLDVGIRRDSTVAAVCHAEKLAGAEHPRVVVDRMQVWTPKRLRPVQLSQVEEWVEEAARRYNRARVRFDPWQAVHLTQRLKRAGITVEEFTFSASSVGKLATVLLQLIRERALALPDDDELLDELRNLRVRETSPGVYRLDHDRDRHDDRGVALALAASRLVERAGARPARVLSSFKHAGPRLISDREMEELSGRPSVWGLR
jgi:hypothetical protein